MALNTIAILLSIREVDGVHRLRIPVLLVGRSGPFAGDQPDSEESHGTASNKLASVISVGPLEVSIEHGTSKNN